MATLNQLSTANTLTSSDQIIFYSTINGSGRKASLATLLDWIEGAWMSPAYQRVTASPTIAGFTVQLPSTANSLFLLLTPTGTMATGTIVLPAVASAADGQEIIIYTTQEITALSFNLNGATALNGAPTGIQANASITLRYDALSLAWYTTEKPSSVGSGTTGYLPKWSAPTTIGNSIVQENATGIGIGGASILGAKLSVFGNELVYATDADVYHLTINSASTAPRSVMYDARNYTGSAPGDAFFRGTVARGTSAAPLAVQAADTLGAFVSHAYDGTNFFEAGRAQFYAETNWLASRDTTFVVSTSTSGTVTNKLKIFPVGDVSIETNGAVFKASYTGQGIKLPSTPGNADPNVLDAYSEGTFTPVYNGSGIAGTVTFAGRYQRTGNQMLLEISINVAAGSSLTYTIATDFFDNFPSAVKPSFTTVVGSNSSDYTIFSVFSAPPVFKAGLSKSGTATLSFPANTAIRFSVTYMI